MFKYLFKKLVTNIGEKTNLSKDIDAVTTIKHLEIKAGVIPLSLINSNLQGLPKVNHV